MQDTMLAHSHPAAAPRSGSYSSALAFAGFLIVSGQGPFDATGNVVQGSIEEETGRTLENVRLHLQAAGARLDQVVRCGCFLADMRDFAAFDRVYRTFFREPFPCRTTVQAGLDGIKVEIDALAYTGS
jgi:2-iminobutanoate/2-iminopropanoate deaminase